MRPSAATGTPTAPGKPSCRPTTRTWPTSPRTMLAPAAEPYADTEDRVTTKEELAERYGRAQRPIRRRLFWIAVTGVAALSVAALAWLTVSNSFDDVGFDETGFELVDARTVTVSFQATPPAGAAFACAVQALDEDFGIVGWRVVEYPGSEETTRAFVETIPTVAQATTGTVKVCWVT